MNAYEEALQRALSQMKHIADGGKPTYNPKASLEAMLDEKIELAKKDPRRMQGFEVNYTPPSSNEISRERIAESIERFYENTRFKD